MKQYVLSLVIAIAAIAVLTRPAPAQNAEPLPVIATFSILEDLVRNVGEGHVEITTFVDAGTDPHTFEPSPLEVVALTEAALIFENGLDFEPWLDDIYGASESNAQRVVVSDGIDVINDDEHEGDHDADEHEDDDSHQHGDTDPHVWQSVTNAMIMVDHIVDALTEADPANANDYAANADQYLAELQALDDDIFTMTSAIPEEQRKLVTMHDTFGYYADRYGFQIVGTALGSLTTESGDPAAGDIVDLVDSIESAGVVAVFPENTQNAGLLEQIASEAGIIVGPPLYTDALGEPGSPGDTYISMMRFNTESIVETLSGS